MMNSGWHCVLWLCAAVTLTLSQDSDQDGGIRGALDLYNQKQDGEFLFKILSDLPANLQEEEGDSAAISFLIKETDCRRSEDNDLETCDYRRGGEVKACALYREEEEAKCVSLSKNLRTKRSSKKGKCNFLCKTKRKLKSIGSKTVIGTVVHRPIIG